MRKRIALGILLLLVFSKSAFCGSEEEMGQAAEKPESFVRLLRITSPRFNRLPKGARMTKG